MANSQMHMKLLVIVFVMITFTFSGGTNTFAQERQVNVYLDGNVLQFEVPPMIVDGFTYVPMRTIFEAHGASVIWDDIHQVITSRRDNNTINYSIKDTKLFVNDKEVPIDRKSIVVNNRTLVPLRFISEALGSVVSWDKETYSVHIKSTVHDAAVPDTTVQSEAPSEMVIAMNSYQRSNALDDAVNKLQLVVEHYGVESKQLYSYIHIYNYSNNDVHMKLEPSNKKIVRLFAKEKEPIPSMNLADCTVVNNQVTYDPVTGKSYNIPSFSTDEACLKANEAKKSELDHWLKENYGPSETGSNMVTVRRYIQDADGALSDFVVPSNSSETLIIVAPIEDNSHLIISGSEYAGSDLNTKKNFKLDYHVASFLPRTPELDLGMYEFIYKSSTY